MQIYSTNLGTMQITELKLPPNNQASTLVIVRHLEYKEEILKCKLYNYPEIMNPHFFSLNDHF